MEPPVSAQWSANLGTGRSLVRLVAGMSAAIGLLLMMQPLLRHLHYGQLGSLILPPAARRLADFTSVIGGGALVALAYELLLRKRVAWYAATLVCLVAGGSHLVIAWQALTPSAVLLLFLLALLIAARRQFVSHTKHVDFRHSLLAFGISIAIALVYGVAGLWLLDRRDLGFELTFSQSVVQTLREYSGLGSGLIPHSRYGRWLLDSIHLFGGATALYCLYSLLRPLRYELRTRPAERARARQMLEQYGGGVDDYFKLWPADKSYFFSRDGRAFITYGVARGVAVAVADPVGQPKAIAVVLAEFTAFCLENGWLPAHVLAADTYAGIYQAQDYQRLVVGADAVIELPTFVNETVRGKQFRNIKNRFTKAGFSAEQLAPPHSPELLRELRAVSDDWRQLPGHREWYFMAGRFHAGYLQTTPLFVLRSPDGQVVAFANLLPSFKAGEATIDLMRHRRDAPSNTMDYLFIALLSRLAEAGYSRFNLGLSPLAGGRTRPATSAEKLLGQIYLLSQRFVATKGLDRFKSKYQPDWQSRCVYYLGGASNLPHVALALARLTKRGG